MKLVMPESLRAGRTPTPKELDRMILAHAAFKAKQPPENSVHRHRWLANRW